MRLAQKNKYENPKLNIKIYINKLSSLHFKIIYINTGYPILFWAVTSLFMYIMSKKFLIFDYG